jgi:hypothetical protein
MLSPEALAAVSAFFIRRAHCAAALSSSRG